MEHYVFNGDADGLCALQQLRLQEHGPAQLVTGPKRDIALVHRVQAQPGDRVSILDVSFDVNRAAVLGLLENGVAVRYFDHHFAGDLPADPSPGQRLEIHIDTAPERCTSLIVNDALRGARRRWAAVGAFGDNLQAAAVAVLGSGARDDAELSLLRELGECLNYNSYGESEADLFVPPGELHARLIAHDDPAEFVHQDPLFEALRDGFRDDLARAQAVRPHAAAPHAAVYLLPCERWARRASGVLGNALANRFPERAHAVLTPRTEGGCVVSVRAPKVSPVGAASLCRRYRTGGGREAAAGINVLPEETIGAFCGAFMAHFSGRQAHGAA